MPWPSGGAGPNASSCPASPLIAAFSGSKMLFAALDAWREGEELTFGAAVTVVMFGSFLLGRTLALCRGAAFGVSSPAVHRGTLHDEDPASPVRRAGHAARPARSRDRGFYVNSATERDEADIRDNYGANHARLARLKDRYDSGNQFRLNVNVKPGKA